MKVRYMYLLIQCEKELNVMINNQLIKKKENTIFVNVYLLSINKEDDNAK